MSNNKKHFEDKFSTEFLQGKRVVVGFSGGADSVSLLYRLMELREDLGLTVEAVHLNHCLRGEESLRDENFVREFCRQYGVSLQVKQIDVAKLAAETGLSVETCGREERYRFFEEAAGTDGMIATAHTLSDNMETVVFHMIRGTALKGLCGIPAVRGNIVRPLLQCTREDVEDYCRRKGLSFVTDSSNLSTDYLRNKIRAEIIPKFFEINPSADRSFDRMITALQKDEEYLDGMACGLWNEMQRDGFLSLEPITGQPEVILSRISVKILEYFDFPLEYQNVDRVARLLQAGEGRQEMGRNVYLKAKGSRLFFEETAPEIAFFRLETELPKAGGTSQITVAYNEVSGNFSVCRSRTLKLQVLGREDAAHFEKIYKNLLIFALDYDTIIGKLVFRQKLGGDRLKTMKSNGTKTLKKFFNEKKVPVADRRRALVVCDDAGILAAEFLGVSRRAAVTEDTKRMLLITEEQ